MRRFLIKLAIFSLPILFFVGYAVYEVLVLPIAHFTFRSWEALSVYEKNAVLSGPFYPNTYLAKKELGDLSDLTKLPVPKEVEWFTDQYGYRKKNSDKEKFEIIVIGDSSTAGSSLTQSETFTEVLEANTGLGVYPYAPSDFNKFLEEERFKEIPPKVVIIETVEKTALSLSEIPPEDAKRAPKSFSGLSETSLAKVAISIDRLKKKAFVNYLYARLEELPKLLTNPELRRSARGKSVSENFGTGKREEMVFYSEPDEYFKEWNDAHIKRVTFTLRQYQDRLKQTNTALVFMPIPNKENIYWRQVKGGKATTNLERLIDAAEAAGITTVDLWTAYNNLYKQNPDKLLYHTDDTHWNKYGVTIAAEKTALIIRKLLGDMSTKSFTQSAD